VSLSVAVDGAVAAVLVEKRSLAGGDG